VLLLLVLLGCAGGNGESRTETRTTTGTTGAPHPAAAVVDSGPPPITFEIPAEVAIPVGRTARGEVAEISVLAAETIAGHPRARVRIVVGPGDHEVDLVAGGPPIDVDGVRVRFLRMDGIGPVFTVDRGSEGWSPREP
jgi:hypothetical protein